MTLAYSMIGYVIFCVFVLFLIAVAFRDQPARRK